MTEAQNPADEIANLSAEVTSMLHRSRHALDLLRAVPARKEGRRSRVELRALVAELDNARRNLVAIRRGLTAAVAPVARGAVLTQLEIRSAGMRALLARADDIIAVAVSEAGGGTLGPERQVTNEILPQ